MFNYNLGKRVGLLFALMLALTVSALTVSADGFTGVAPSSAETANSAVLPIEPVITEIGFITASVDGVGTTSDSGTLQVAKPTGATVRSAYLMSASRGFSGITISDGDITINGTGVTWQSTTSSSISSVNHFANVTSIVKPIVDGSPAGLIDLTIGESDSFDVEGSVLAVIFDDPNQTSSNTVVLLFGAQNISGDTFSIGLAEPIDTSSADFGLTMGVGISFGAQGAGDDQYSQIDVNGTRMTTSAGGEDDGSLNNGALITVGGIGDSTDNPADPNAIPTGDPRIDDELYNLVPFVNDGDTSIVVDTVNPSDDDNIFFAYLLLGDVTAVVGEGIVLAPPPSAACPFDADQTVTATVQASDGSPFVGVDVDFEVISGPHMGISGSAESDADGKASFTYSGTMTGVDTVVASFNNGEGPARSLNGGGEIITSNEVQVNWECAPTDVSLSDLTGSASGQSFLVIAVALSVAVLLGVGILRRRA